MVAKGAVISHGSNAVRYSAEKEKAEIVKVLSDTPQSASEIAGKVEISTQKASALLRQIDGLTVSELKVKGKGKVKGYALA